MPDSHPARRILGDAMRYDPADAPAAHLDRLSVTVERDPAWQARQERIRRVSTRRPLAPYRDGPATARWRRPQAAR